MCHRYNKLLLLLFFLSIDFMCCFLSFPGVWSQWEQFWIETDGRVMSSGNLLGICGGGELEIFLLSEV
jgi:hypothetical protein